VNSPEWNLPPSILKSVTILCCPSTQGGSLFCLDCRSLLGEAVRLEELLLKIQNQLDTLLVQLKVRSGTIIAQPVIAAEVAAEVDKPNEIVDRTVG